MYSKMIIVHYNLLLIALIFTAFTLGALLEHIQLSQTQ